MNKQHFMSIFFESPNFVILDGRTPEAFCCGQSLAILRELVPHDIQGLAIFKKDLGIENQCVAFPI